MPAVTAARSTLETRVRLLLGTAAFSLVMQDRHRILLHRVNLNEKQRKYSASNAGTGMAFIQGEHSQSGFK
jgi:hypothetical protein